MVIVLPCFHQRGSALISGLWLGGAATPAEPRLAVLVRAAVDLDPARDREGRQQADTELADQQGRFPGVGPAQLVPLDAAPEPRSKLRLAYGLIATGAVTNADHDVARFILDQIAVAAADDSANLVEGLSRLSDQNDVIQQLRQRAVTASATDPAARNRYLVAALSLGDKTPLEEFQIVDGDPTQRTRSIRDFPAWPGDLHRVAELLPR